MTIWEHCSHLTLSERPILYDYAPGIVLFTYFTLGLPKKMQVQMSFMERVLERIPGLKWHRKIKVCTVWHRHDFKKKTVNLK